MSQRKTETGSSLTTMPVASKEPGDNKTQRCEPAARLSRETEQARETERGGACGTLHRAKHGSEAGPEIGTEGVRRVVSEQRSRDANGSPRQVVGGKRPRGLEEWQQHQQEFEEEEEEQEEQEEGEQRAMLTDAVDAAELEEEDEASRENDGFLEDFAKELDGASSCGEGEDEEEEEEEEEEQGRKGKVGGVKRETQREDDDAQVACALQEEEWRRNLPPLPGEFASGVPVTSSDGGGSGGRCRASRAVRSASSGGSIFDADGSGGGSSSGSIFDLDRAGEDGCSAESGAAAGSCETFFEGADSGRLSRRNDETGHGRDGTSADGGRSPPIAAGRGAVHGGVGRLRGEEGGRAGGGGRQARGKGKERAVTPAAWPPGGLGEGEGLRINDLPDEIVDNIAGFALLPRCVSKRIERYRVKVVRERVIGALESSAKLPASKAEEVEDAIFALCGNYVTKAYKAKAREMSFNLRVGKNDPLRERLLTGSLPPSQLVRMSSDELAPLSVRRERERLARKRIREVTSSRDSPFHTVTDRFTCQECGHERTQYRTWRRKAVVDRVRVIVQCLQCRHSWEL